MPTKITGARPRRAHAYPILRRRLRWAQGGICPYCGRWLRPYDDDDPHRRAEQESLEHVFPASRGYTLKANALIVHKPCNEKKGNRTPTGCELLWLYCVNTRLGIAGGPERIEDGREHRDQLD